MQGLTMEATNPPIEIRRIIVDGEKFFRITNNDFMRPFFMSVVSDSNHWMFISSNGGLTAGRKNANHALFPYYTDDKVSDSFETTGSKTILRVTDNEKTHVWEPFSIRSDGFYNTTRNLYKSVFGNKIIFEEINHDLGLAFRYQWSSSNKYGFVRKSTIENRSSESKDISFIDGIQNILPASVNPEVQNTTSNLVDAYKRSELVKKAGIGLYSLTAIIVDKAEPSEALKTNVAWSFGLENPTHLLSGLQFNSFRKGLPVTEETDIKAEKGAYMVQSQVYLAPGDQKEWSIVADVNKDHSAVIELIHHISNNNSIESDVQANIDLGTQRLTMLNGSADGLQLTADKFKNARHYSNTLFNIMRGGVFDDNYTIEKWDFLKYLETTNRKVRENQQEVLAELPDTFSLFELREKANVTTDMDFKRLCIEYMPLKFSRRHGDPSRPWNKFSINTRSEIDGSKILDYEGNWRDIFQNWEALALSFPAFCEGMIFKFLNASTFEGYNPYRVTKDGFDWETIEPDNPWSYIGYWGDHQVIYLLKLLELNEKYYPGTLGGYLTRECFVYANVPYKVKSYQSILENSKDTIEFDEELDSYIRRRRKVASADAALIHNENNVIYKVNLIEKILAMVLTKLSNFIPEGGIWMNTQRPEWNDANNALVGNGVSMVTLYYLRRFLLFFRKLLPNESSDRVPVSNELIIFYKKVRDTFEANTELLTGNELSNAQRRSIVDALGEAGSTYRDHIYKQGFWGEKRTVSYTGLNRLISLSLQFIDHSIKANKRSDGLYHAYNLMTVEGDSEMSISHLSEMLEGQVAVLSSGYLKPKEALSVLDALKKSSLFREDQYSYLLYPAKELSGFMDKNNIPASAIHDSSLLSALVENGNERIVIKDMEGKYHFNSNFKNAEDVKAALFELEQSEYAALIEQDRQKVLATFELVFDHMSFTGRSGTFYGYEGLGSIYWHMVSKLLLAVQEVCIQAVDENESDEIIGKLLEHYYEINAGLGVHKSPELYGAFPTDPYSHTPAGKGAQQPGMTGQVKEDILCRFGELGVVVEQGKLTFNPSLLQRGEFIKKPRTYAYVDIEKNFQTIDLDPGSLAFTYCQVPVVYVKGRQNRLFITNQQGKTEEYGSLTLDRERSVRIFNRSGEIRQITVHIDEAQLK